MLSSWDIYEYVKMSMDAAAAADNDDTHSHNLLFRWTLLLCWLLMADRNEFVVHIVMSHRWQSHSINYLINIIIIIGFICDAVLVSQTIE